MSCPFANVNELWSRTLAETLRAKGVRYAVICPGSRSSPLAFAFARTEGIEAIPVLDERSAAFFALGLAKRAGVPTALVCTSGTAAANFFPAIIEASESGTPLFVLTADRPHELRRCRAGQTIDQVRLYGDYPVGQTELMLPKADVRSLADLRDCIAGLADRSLAPRSGPIHVNIPFRDPLPPIMDGVFEMALSSDEWGRLFETISPVVDNDSPAIPNLSDFANVDRGVIIAGAPLCPIGSAWIENVASLAAALKWPVLADALNPIRNHAERFPYLITGYHAICRSLVADEELLPEKAIVLGDLPISAALRSWLERNDIEMLFLNSLGGKFDPTHSRSRMLYFDFSDGTPVVEERTDADFAKKWMQRDGFVQEALQGRLERIEGFFEGKVASVLSKHLPSECSLFVSNSMPPRDMESYWSRNDSHRDIYCSRGANGIDGILSTALGGAHRGKPAYLLIGDLALLHDSNGALIGRFLKGSLTIILINNSGGGIFEMLPVATLGAEFEQFFVTDQQIDFQNWTRTYGFEYKRPKSWNEFAALVEQPHQSGVRLIEVVTNGKADSQRRKQWFSEIAESIN